MAPTKRSCLPSSFATQFMLYSVLEDNAVVVNIAVIVVTITIPTTTTASVVAFIDAVAVAVVIAMKGNDLVL